MAGLDGRLRRLEDAHAAKGRAGLTREALAQLSDEELDALEEELLAQARAGGEQPPPNEFLLEKMSRWEAETIEQQHRHAEESRRRARKGAPR